jgi:hypothetical protein
MVAKPVFKTGFETVLKPVFSENWKSVSNRFSVLKNRFQTGFQFSKPVFDFQNRFETGFRFSKPV